MTTQLENLLIKARNTGVGAPNIPWCGTKKIFNNDVIYMHCSVNNFKAIISNLNSNIRFTDFEASIVHGIYPVVYKDYYNVYNDPTYSDDVESRMMDVIKVMKGRCLELHIWKVNNEMIAELIYGDYRLFESLINTIDKYYVSIDQEPDDYSQASTESEESDEYCLVSYDSD